jgi:hypothetical protein
MTLDSFSPAGLAQQVAGPVLVAGDEGYAEETFAWNLATPQAPAVVVGATSAEDVQAAVRFAARHELPVAVLATGHGMVAPSDGALLINVRRLTGVRIDAEAQTATVGAATEWQDVVAAAAEAGLAPVSGSSPNVGAVGYTLGGGLSPVLGRRHGWASDHVRELQLVTPDGELRTVTADSEPDLFWAVRGGKSTLGVVVSMTFALLPVTRFYGGGLYYAAEHAPPLIAEFRRLAALDDDRLTVSFAFLRMPPLPFVPEPLRGRVTLHLRFSYLGSEEEGARLVAPLRAIAPTLIDTVGELPYAEHPAVHNDPLDPVPAYERAALLTAFPAEAAEALVAVAGAGVDTSALLVEVRQLGGALARDPEVPSALSHRDAPFSLLAATMGAPDDAALTGIIDALKPWHHPGSFINFLSAADAVPDRVRAAYSPEAFERLLRVKRTYDPANLFRVHHALVPAGTE